MKMNKNSLYPKESRAGGQSGKTHEQKQKILGVTELGIRQPGKSTKDNIFFKDTVETIREPVLVLDSDLRVLYANRSFYKTFRITARVTVGHLIYDLGNRQWDIPKLRILLEEILPKAKRFNDYQVDHVFPAIGKRIMLLNARQIANSMEKQQLILLAIEDVTDRIRIEQDLHASEERFRKAFETAKDGILLIDKISGQIVNSNQAALDILGYSIKELQKQKIWQIGFLRDAGQFQNITNQLKEKGFVDFNDTLVKTRQGKEMAADVYWMDTIKLFQCNIRDNTARKQAEEALLKAGALQSAIFNSANFSSIATDAKGVIQIFNVGAERMLGYAAADVMNKITPADISDSRELIARAKALSIELSTPITPGFEALVFKASRGIEDIYELTYIRKDGSRFPAVVSVMALRDAQDAIIGYLLIGTDNTARKKADEQLKIMLKDLERSNKELEQFAYVASHDLQEPLRMVAIYPQLLEKRYKDKLDGDALDFIHYAVAGANRMQALVNDLLSYSRIGTHSEPFKLVSSLTALGQARMNLNATIKENNTIVTNDDLPDVLADESQLVQLFQNLIGNAIKFHKPGESPRVHISIKSKDENWVFSVRDNGIGIEPQYFERIFVIFQRLNTREEYKGTGIGLAVCKKIVERHGGKIWVESQPGKGSTFYFTLNKLVWKKINSTMEAEIQSNEFGKPIEILLADDNPGDVRLAIEALKDGKIHNHVNVAQDGMEAIAYLRKQGKYVSAPRPDVILLDLNMPRKDGREVLAEIKNDPDLRRIPIVILTISQSEQDILKSYNLHANCYITKPVDLEQFNKVVHSIEEFWFTIVKLPLNE